MSTHPISFVGSIPLPDAASVLRAVARTDAHRLPDGEVGERYYWIQFQASLFDRVDGLERVGEPGYRIRDQFDVRKFRITGEVTLPPLGYADAAIASYAAFRALRDDGVIPSGTRFQVSLPTPVGVVAAFLEPDSSAAFEPVYRDALLAELAALTAQIPAEDLAIQWDVATEFAILERDRRPAFQIEPWWEGADVDGVVSRLVALGDAVPAGAELGYHLCYGDVEESHFVQPEDASLLAEVAAGILAGVQRQVDWIHLPVPIERDDAGYFAPLAALEAGETEIVLGLVHPEDGVEGARRRAAAASAAVPRFGIATECGLGRGKPEEALETIELHREVQEALAD